MKLAVKETKDLTVSMEMPATLVSKDKRDKRGLRAKRELVENPEIRDTPV